MVAFRVKHTMLITLVAILILSAVISVRKNHHKAVLDYLEKYTRLKVLQTLYPEKHFTTTNYTEFKFMDPTADNGNEVFDKFFELDSEPNYQKENATLFSLVRNEELYLMLQSIKQVEDRFNKRYHYDWIFANDDEFDETFRTEVTNMVSGNVTFVKIPDEYWSYPKWIDQDKAQNTRKKMRLQGIKYGGSESYRHMCRFNSGFFYKLKAFEGIKYYWRVEPDIQFNCDIDYDVFRFMRENNKKYGFAMTLHELHRTVYGLFEATKDFFRNLHPDYVAQDNTVEFVTLDGEQSFNMCHYWSNFEIGDLDFLRSKPYEEYFQHLDKLGGFFYERWGDAPIHTFAVSYMLNKSELHYFDNTGYYHVPHTQCPRVADIRDNLHCTCLTSIDYNWGNRDSCLSYYYEVTDQPRPAFAPKKIYSTHRPLKNSKRDLQELFEDETTANHFDESADDDIEEDIYFDEVEDQEHI